MSQNKNKIFPLLPFLLFSTVFLSLPSGSIADENELMVTEIMYDPEGTDTGHSDWIEIYNNDPKEIKIKKENFGIIDEKDLELGTDRLHYKNCHSIDRDLEIGPGEYAVIAEDNKDFEKDYPLAEKSAIYDSAFSLSSDGDYLHLSSDKCTTFFLEFNYEDSWGGKNNGMTLEKKELDNKYSKDAWQESYATDGTPAAPNSEKPKPKEYTAKIILNEIFPHPDKNQEEYIELYNREKKGTDLENYILRDGSTTGKYVFPKNTEINDSEYLVVYKKDFDFSLNDSGHESIFLYDPNGTLIDSMEYDKTKENYSWNFDGAKWRLSHFLTPGTENIFEHILTGKVIMDDVIYANIYANFEADADSDAQKFTWDFGDGHKSYLQKTRHKYEKSGKYEANLKITGNGEDNLYNFSVTVEDYDAPNVKIISLIPNPKGKDSGEYMILENKSKKKVDLLNWSIATGWEKLYNHPIRKKFILKKDEKKKLTKKICAFTLNNTKTKIELRDPTGHVVQKLKYDRTKDKIIDDEILELNNKEWRWNKPKNTEEDGKGQKFLPPTGLPPADEIDTNTVSQSEITSDIGKFTDNPAWQDKKENQIELLNYNLEIKPPEIILADSPHILGVSTEKYAPPEKHWLVKIIESIWTKINLEMNWILNYF